MRSCYCEKVQNLYGKIQLLNRKQVDVNSLYVDVYFLEKLSSESYATIPKLLEDSNIKDSFDRIGLGKRQKRTSGLEVVDKSSRLVVLGKPGSGKSTFLRYLAVSCSKKKLLTDCIPFLIELRAMGDARKLDLLNLIHQEFRLSDIEQTKKILDDGKVLILLDGLDEVSTQSQRTVQDHLIEFSQQYYKNRFVLTCRTQTAEYILTGFDYVEVADFNSEQVKLFSQNWFAALAQTPQEGIKLKKQLISKLENTKNQRIAELAVTPILLSLTCWIFADLEDLPYRRSDLYKQGLNLLLEQWDTARGINRDSENEIYKKLSTGEKIKLLSYLAAEKFKQKQPILFQQSEIQNNIIKYLGISEKESQLTLNEIEEQHGLLIERAKQIWSFSHLTFQEYFTSKWFVENNLYESLQYIKNNRFREVFFLIIEMIENTELDYFLEACKKEIDDSLAQDKKIQLFLSNLHNKALNSNSSSRMSAYRAFLFSISLNIIDYDADYSGFAPPPMTDFYLVEKLDPSFHSKLNPSLAYRDVDNSLNQNLNQEQITELIQYYDANKLLIDLLDAQYILSDRVKKEIEETLLLPIAEIENRQQSNS